jgi:hypothetical protein
LVEFHLEESEGVEELEQLRGGEKFQVQQQLLFQKYLHLRRHVSNFHILTEAGWTAGPEQTPSRTGSSAVLGKFICIFSSVGSILSSAEINPLEINRSSSLFAQKFIAIALYSRHSIFPNPYLFHRVFFIKALIIL